MMRGREGKRPRVYVLGDDPELNRDLTQDLSAAGWEVRCFPAFEGLVAAWEKSAPECVMVDSEWHAVDAAAVFRLHRLYREMPRASRVPFILMVDAVSLDGRAAEDSGAVLRLPYRPDDLIAVLNSVQGPHTNTSSRGRHREADPLARGGTNHAVDAAADALVSSTRSGPPTTPGPPRTHSALATEPTASVAAEPHMAAPAPALRVVGATVAIPDTIAPLPALAPDELPMPARPRRDPKRPITVLIADEDEVVLDLLAYHASNQGWTVLTSSDGEETEALVRERHPDIAVLGGNLPYRSGFDIVERLRDEAVAYDTRFVALSAQSQADNVLRAFGVGFSEFIGKPFDPTVVMGRLQRLVSGV